jgi:hypothetical protein
MTILSGAAGGILYALSLSLLESASGEKAPWTAAETEEVCEDYLTKDNCLPVTITENLDACSERRLSEDAVRYSKSPGFVPSSPPS